MKEIRIATRASKLALAQANLIREQLLALSPEIPISLVKITTKGDRDKSDFLYKSSSVGFFTSEVENALLENKADIAVHSLKDLPTAITSGLKIAAIPKRESPCDVIVTAKKISSVGDLPQNATVGTSSLRRITQLKRIRPDLDCQPLRGNIETRLAKVQQKQIDAIVIAQAGLNRLDLSEHASLVLPPDSFIPAPGQGALAVQTRENDTQLNEQIAKLNDPETFLAVTTERKILAGLHGGCSIPLGVYAIIQNEAIDIHTTLANFDASNHIDLSVSCLSENADQTAEQLTRQILEQGGKEIIEELHKR